MNPDRLDMDPPPRRSARLVSDPSVIPHAIPASVARSRRPTPHQTRTMRLLIAVKAMKEATPPIPNPIIADVLGISGSTVDRLWKRVRILKMRQSRV
jgi:hypothetical protein